jgi:hypothetical protein
MKKQRIKAKVADLVLNEGQLDWLPENPRSWTRTDIDRTIESLKRDPDFQEDNPLKVVPFGDKLLVFAGNLRTTGAREIKWDTFEAMLYEPETEEDKATIKRRAILDNGSFGSWDYDRLANEWDDLPLCDFGVPAWGVQRDDLNVDSFFEQAMAHKEAQKEGDITIEVVIPEEESDLQEEIEQLVKTALAGYPNIKVQR